MQPNAINKSIISIYCFKKNLGGIEPGGKRWSYYLHTLCRLCMDLADFLVQLQPTSLTAVLHANSFPNTTNN